MLDEIVLVFVFSRVKFVCFDISELGNRLSHNAQKLHH